MPSFLWGLLGSAVEAQKVVSVEVQGELRKVAKSLILTTVGLEPGIELSQENVQQAVRDLQGLNVFEDIQIWGDPAPEGINLIIMVEEYPSLEGLQFKGQKNLKEKDLKEALSLITGQVIAPKDVVRGEQKILALYREKGYLRAEVKGQTFAGAEEGEVFLQYDINEGSQGADQADRLDPAPRRRHGDRQPRSAGAQSSASTKVGWPRSGAAPVGVVDGN